jgi:ATP-dependent exoDNAse (exonuclease V) alpha subunit
VSAKSIISHSRNLFYTVISRAKKEIILYGDPQAVDIAMQKLPQRESMLVSKTRMLLA